MKGYISNHILYVFPQEATEIPYVDESVEAIAIQPELLDAFKEANHTYADIMFSYNYQIIAVNPKPFAGHTDDDIEVPEEPTAEPTPEPPAQVNWSGYIDADGDYNLTIGNDPATRAAAITAYSADNWQAIGSVEGPHISYNGNDIQYTCSDQTLQGVFNGDDLVDRHIIAQDIDTTQDILDIHIYLHTNTSTNALEVIEDYADGVYTASEVGYRFLFYVPQQ